MMRKIYKLFVACLIAGFTTATAFAQNNIELTFNKEGKFKIAQFTDLHWSNSSPEHKITAKTIEDVLKKEEPGLAILTGDVITDHPAAEGWKELGKIFEQYQTPWAVTLGNHDAEAGLTRDEIFELLVTLPYFVGEKGEEMYGCGNYTIEIKSKDGEVKSVLYCIDSNDYTGNEKLGGYDWIRFDQVEWYRRTSKVYAEMNNQKPIPSLAFFHIPLLEYNKIGESKKYTGNKNEGVSSSHINSGIFASMLEMKDMMGMFVGHDHDNDHIGLYKDIALAYGRVTGSAPYGGMERGSRIIELQKDTYSFKTWISTPTQTMFQYSYPSGVEYNLEGKELMKAVKVKNLQNGISYKYYEGKFSSTKEMMKQKPLKEGTTNKIDIHMFDKKDYYGFEFEAYIKIDQAGIYKFYTYSDDGSVLLINDTKVVDNDGTHSAQRKEGIVGLEKGYHKLTIRYIESYMGQVLDAGLAGLTIRETSFLDNTLFIKK